MEKTKKTRKLNGNGFYTTSVKKKAQHRIQSVNIVLGYSN